MLTCYSPIQKHLNNHRGKNVLSLQSNKEDKGEKSSIHFFGITDFYLALYYIPFPTGNSCISYMHYFQIGTDYDVVRNWTARW